MALVSMLLGSANWMEKAIESWKLPEDHKGHTAELECGYYCGSGEYSINYKCSCGKGSWNLGSADPDLISDSVWNQNSKKT